MGYYDQVAEGSDKNEFRLWIEGIDAGFVTSSEDIRAGVNSTTNFEPWYVGLQRDGMEFSQDADITQARIKASTMTLRIADIGGVATSVFAQNPNVVAYLTDTISDSDTSIPVTDSSLFSVGQLVYCGTETWYVSAKPDAVTLTVSRTWRGTQGVFQYTEDGDRQRTPEVTDKPRVFEGRRCRLYCKGEGDTGWTAVFYGTLATEPRLVDLVSWELNIDPVTKILDQEIGPDEKGLPVRGIQYSSRAPFRMKFYQYTTSGLIPDGQFTIYMAGFWESQEDFCVELRTQIAAEQAGSGVDYIINAVPNGPDQIKFTFNGTASGQYPDVQVLDWHATQIDTWVQLETFDETNVPDANISTGQSIHAVISAPFPRGYYGPAPYYDPRVLVPSASVAYHGKEVFYGGSGSIGAINKIATISGTESTNGDFYVDPAFLPAAIGPRSFCLFPVDSSFGAPSLSGPYGPDTMIRFSVDLFAESAFFDGTVGDLFQALIDLSPVYSSLGYVPFISSTDLDASTSIINVNRATSGTPNLRHRKYASTKGVRLGELIAEECKLIGCYLSINSAGQIVIKQVAALGTTDTPVAAIDESNTLMSISPPAQERNAYGIFNTAVVRTGYKWETDEYQGPTVQIRSVQDFGSSRRARPLTIEPKGVGIITEDEVSTALASWFAQFAKPYTIVSVDVPFTLFQVYIGDTVTLVSDKLPDYDTGDRGWTVPKRCMVTGRRWNLNTGVGTLTLLVTGQAYAGYTPSLYITANTGGSPVTSTTLTVNDNLPTPFNNTSLLPSGTLVTDFFSIGDRVSVHRFNATAATLVQGVVTSVSTTQIGVTFDSAWTPGAFEWILTYSVSNDTDITEGQRRYAYVAGNDRLIDFDAQAVSARVLA